MEIISKYFPELTAIQNEQFSRLLPLYQEWNEKINVISRKDIDRLYERHVLHSLAIAKIIRFRPNTSVLDIGTGGGFPGIPLAILFPEVKFHLVDSIGKKIKVVEEVTSALRLKNVSFEKKRAEALTGKYDFIVSRAVTSLPVFVNWVRKLVSFNQLNELKNGILYIKGGNVSDELNQLKYRTRIFPINQFFGEPFFETKNIIHIY